MTELTPERLAERVHRRTSEREEENVRVGGRVEDERSHCEYFEVYEVWGLEAG